MTNISPWTELLDDRDERWLVTGAAGFIGSNLVEALLLAGQRVVGIDNFSNGLRRNLPELERTVGPEAWSRFEFIEGDIRSPDDCQRAVQGARYVLHQAALGSVPRSLADPLNSHQSNVTGTLNMLVAARDASVERFVYAGSSSTYGDHPALPKVEDRIGRPLSPYAVTKYAVELYADVFARSYGMSIAGLRYFNVFGKRQTPDGAYAAVIPKWIGSLIRGETVFINGDGETSRDFSYIDNVVQANLRAALRPLPSPHEVYNVAVGDRTTLNQLFEAIVTELSVSLPHLQGTQPEYRDFRPGDVAHSLANVDKAVRQLGYRPTHRVAEGLRLAMPWYIQRLSEPS